MGIEPTGLRVGDRVRPLNVEGVPELSWQPAFAQAAFHARAWVWDHRILDGHLLWDSGWVATDRQSHVRYGGPPLAPGTTCVWRVRLRAADGTISPWSARCTFDTALRDEDWQALWIRRPNWDHDEHTLARRELDLGDAPVARARVHVAGLHYYELRLNGEPVLRGAASAYPDAGYHQAADVTQLIAKGGRVVLGAILHWYGPGQGRPEAEPGLLVRLVVERRNGSRTVVVSDGDWRLARGWWLPAPYRNDDGRDYIEVQDGRAEPLGWDRPGFDDGGWQAPEVIGPHPTPPFTHLQALEAGVAVEELRPKSVTRPASGGVVADFGRVIAARLAVRFDGEAAREVAMRAGYLLDSDGVVSRTEGTQQTDLSYRYVQRGGDERFVSFTHLGFRYLQLDEPPREISALAQHTDMDLSRTATFRCSEPLIDRVFELALHSALYSAQDHFVDTPTREKGQFLNDAINQSLALMAGYGERRLTRQAIREFVESQRRYWPDGRLNAVYPNGDGRRDIPDFTLCFPGWVARYHLESGDDTTLEHARPAIQAIAGYLLRHVDPATGLVTSLAGGAGPYAGGIVDWPPTMRYGYDMAVAARTTVNILAVDALRHAGYSAEAERLAAAINDRLRGPDGVYVDGLHSSGTSQIANAYALAFGVAPAECRERVAAHLLAFGGLRMGPMTAHLLLDALAGEGRVEEVVALLRDEDGPGWANILKRGGTFTWESWDAPERGHSLSHGWGATVLVSIQRALLGVEVIEPGAAAVRVCPPLRGLEWAEGTVPTERGPVSVRWRNDGTVKVEAPANVRTDVRGERRGCTENGSPQ